LRAGQEEKQIAINNQITIKKYLPSVLSLIVGGPREHMAIHTMPTQVWASYLVQQQRNFLTWESATSIVLCAPLQRRNKLLLLSTDASKIGVDLPLLWK